MDKLKLVKYGDVVTVKGKYRRGSALQSGLSNRPAKEWVLVEGEVTGIFLGIRTISNGWMDYSEEYQEYNPTEHFRVALISPSALKNPIYAPIPYGVVLRVKK